MKYDLGLIMILFYFKKMKSIYDFLQFRAIVFDFDKYN
jgi:hypothetical protein